MHDLIVFVVVVGFGSTIALDVWVKLREKVIGLPATNWGRVGRWLTGLSHGRLVIDSNDTTAPTRCETSLGWAFHYAVGLAYAAFIPLFWGEGVIQRPSLFPFFVIGLLVSTIAGLVVLYPGMACGLFASKLPNQRAAIIHLICAHAIFAASQFGGAHLASMLLRTSVSNG